MVSGLGGLVSTVLRKVLKVFINVFGRTFEVVGSKVGVVVRSCDMLFKRGTGGSAPTRGNSTVLGVFKTDTTTFYNV